MGKRRAQGRKVNIPQITEADIFAELDRQLDISDDPPRADEFTAVAYAEHKGIALKTAKQRLLKLIKRGTLETRWAYIAGKRRKYYRLIKSDDVI